MFFFQGIIYAISTYAICSIVIFKPCQETKLLVSKKCIYKNDNKAK